MNFLNRYAGELGPSFGNVSVVEIWRSKRVRISFFEKNIQNLHLSDSIRAIVASLYAFFGFPVKAGSVTFGP